MQNTNDPARKPNSSGVAFGLGQAKSLEFTEAAKPTQTARPTVILERVMIPTEAGKIKSSDPKGNLLPQT